MKIAEIYKSVQGEGFLPGTDSAFVRTSGCNLRCWFCDTPYASWTPEGEDLSVDEILARVAAFDMQPRRAHRRRADAVRRADSADRRPARAGRHITIETAGTLYLPVECDLMSISPKLANSTPSAAAGAALDRAARARPGTRRPSFAGWSREYPYQFKFVVDAPADCEEVEAYLRRVPRDRPLAA